MYEYELIELLDVVTQGDIKNHAIRHIAYMDFFGFDIDSQRNIKRFLGKNHMPDGCYLVVGEDDRGFDKVFAVCYFRKWKHNTILKLCYPSKEWEDAYISSITCTNMVFKSYNPVSGDVNLRKYIEKESDKEDGIRRIQESN